MEFEENKRMKKTLDAGGKVSNHVQLLTTKQGRREKHYTLNWLAFSFVFCLQL